MTLRRWAIVTVALLGISAASCASDTDEESSTNELAVGQKPRLELSDEQRREIVTKQATCPFVGTAMALKKIAAYGTITNPFASISNGLGNIVDVGNAGGGDLGEGFKIVARANHHRSPVNGEEAPNGMFSLNLPGSVGAHPAHSGILMGDPRSSSSGRFSEDNLNRLIRLKSAGGHAERAPNGALVVRRSELGRFVARNVACDPSAVTATTRPFSLLSLLGRDIVDFNTRAFEVIRLKLMGNDSSAEMTELLEDMVQIGTSNNLVGAAAEFGLLTTFLAPSEDTVTVNGEPALAVSDITAIFAGDKRDGRYDPLTRRFPSNWDRTPKRIVDLLRHVIYVLKSASVTHLAGDYRSNTDRPNAYPACPRR